MKLLILCAFAVLVVAAAGAPADVQPLPRYQLPPALARVARANPEPKGDLEGSESAYLAYPYAYPYYWGHHYPYVVVGK